MLLIVCIVIFSKHVTENNGEAIFFVSKDSRIGKIRKCLIFILEFMIVHIIKLTWSVKLWSSQIYIESTCVSEMINVIIKDAGDSLFSILVWWILWCVNKGPNIKFLHYVDNSGYVSEGFIGIEHLQVPRVSHLWLQLIRSILDITWACLD